MSIWWLDFQQSPYVLNFDKMRYTSIFFIISWKHLGRINTNNLDQKCKRKEKLMEKERITKKNSPNVTVCGDKGVKREMVTVFYWCTRNKGSRGQRLSQIAANPRVNGEKRSWEWQITTNAWERIEYFKNGKNVVEGKIDKQITIEVI